MQFKAMVTDSLVTHLTPIREEIDRILADQQYMDSVLADGRDVARDLAWETMGQVRQLIGWR